MKIGILTFANVPNFGANLQALSTVCYLRNIGHKPIIIKWEPKDFQNRFTAIKNSGQPKEHFDFCKEYLPWSRQCTTDEDIVKVIEEECIEGIIIGSDAVLQHHSMLSRIHFPTKSIVRIVNITSERIFPNAFWGTFYRYLPKKLPMCIMSASSQNSKYKLLLHSTKKEMTNLLSNFKYISVRDEWTKGMINNVTNGKIIPSITPDPVFAFNQNCCNIIPTKEDILKRFKLPNNYVLVSMKTRLLDNTQWMDELKHVFEKNGLECVAFPMPTGIDFKHNFNYAINTPLSPLDWYALIKYSCAYIGENMHPIVVSLHNSVPCFSFDTYGVLKYARIYCIESSSKIYDIMNRFSVLSNRRNAYSRFWKCPTAEEICNCIISFDKNKCSQNAQMMLESYNNMMKDILKELETY